MELALIFLPLTLIGAALGRWTRWHPLVIAPVVGLLPGAFGMVAVAAFATDGAAILVGTAAAFLLGTGVSGLGAFMGWLRRKHIERMS